MLVTIDDELWHLVETAWAAVPVLSMQSLYYSISRRITAVTAAGGTYSRHWFLRIYTFKFLENLI